MQAHNIHHVCVPASCTDRLQSLDVSVNKAAKDFMKREFQLWYSKQIEDQLEQGTAPEMLATVDLRLSVMKPLGAKRLVAMFDYFCSHPDIIINGFRKTGIADAANLDMYM